MKSNLLRVSVIAVAAAAAACAQSNALIANVPFNFVVNGKTIQGGEISIARMSSSGALTIRNARQAVAVLPLGNKSANGPSQPRLVFHRYGDAYFLAEVWGPDEYGRNMPVGARERELTAKGPVQTRTVALALK